MSLTMWVILIFVALLVIGAISNKAGKASSSVPIRNRPAPSNAHHWDGAGNMEFEIVGESYYQPALKTLAGEHGDKSPDKECKATIVPDDRNQHDDKAVRVDIDGLTVGHFGRDDARSFRRRLGQKKIKGQTTTCDAMIVGGYLMKNGQRASYGVKLDIKPFW